MIGVVIILLNVNDSCVNTAMNSLGNCMLCGDLTGDVLRSNFDERE